MNFRQFSEAVKRHVRAASHAEIDAQYKAGVTAHDGAKNIRASRKARTTRRVAWVDGAGDFDYDLNG